MNYLIKVIAMKLIINTFFSSNCSLLILFLGLTYGVQAQNGSSFSDNLRVGGSLGLGFGDGFFTANLAPSVIYDFNEYWSVGTGLSGSYTSFDDARAYTLGGSALAFFRPIPNIRLSSEFEQLYVNFKRDLDGSTFERNYTYPALFLGAGYTTGSLTVGVKYDVLFDENDSIYSSALVPFVSIYF
jgi:long-subunit fatty acid transport protein